MTARYFSWIRASATKTIAAMLASGAIVMVSGAAAHAQNYPWCAQYSGSMGGSQNCGFSTYAQCQADVSGIGGFCVRNDTYQPSPLVRGHR